MSRLSSEQLIKIQERNAQRSEKCLADDFDTFGRLLEANDDVTTLLDHVTILESENKRLQVLLEQE